MPRPKKPGAPEPKKRSRNGCWPCKNRKIKCGEEHPSCLNCQRAGEACDYSIRLNWDGRRGKRPEPGTIDFASEVPPAPQPSKGFKLVHQYPNSEAGTGRRVEPLGDTPPTRKSGPQPQASGPSMPLSGPLASNQTETSFQRPSKRVKLDSDLQSNESTDAKTHISPSSISDSSRLLSNSAISPLGSPPTPTESSVYSDEDQRQGSSMDPPTGSPGISRLSVHSLLSTPKAAHLSPDGSGRSVSGLSQYSTADGVYYGIDRGFPDLDLDKNDDKSAISGSSPVFNRDIDTPREEFLGEIDGEFFSPEFGFGVQFNDEAEDAGGYYDKPVQIYIPQRLEPLPATLRDNPMNLLYFHFFINHTARVLVPHDDPQANPFRHVLPQMAVKSENLLALVLAYAASHRARFLKQPEPKLRIALWVNDIFPALRKALSDPTMNVSNADLATAIMLASLEIVSPQVFGYSIPWQKHLGLARELIVARPGGLHGMHENFRKDLACSFLWSWAAYLDVIGSLTGGRKDSSSSWVFAYELEDLDDGYDEIDCIMGFSTRCLYILAHIADLARRCDLEKVGEDGKIVEDWQPTAEALGNAKLFESNLKDSLVQPTRPCKHIHNQGDVEKWDRKEMSAANEAFHWAGLVHLYRRVMAKPSDDPSVQLAVNQIIACFDNIRPNGGAESCLMFPMFTAGCEAKAQEQRDFILEKFASVEGSGMTQAHKAKRLMEKAWETGQSWETLFSTDFIG